jgi:S1-C subfamily serine protease
VCHKGRGIILTNHHVVGYSSVATYKVMFANGQKLSARLLYTDPWHDFAFLEVDQPRLMPATTHALDRFVTASVGTRVYIVGNNEGQGFSLQKGYVTNLYQDLGFLPEPSFSAVMNSSGGSSGSPLINDKSEVLGLNYAGDRSGTAYVVHARVCQEALQSLLKNQKPLRRHTGAVCYLHSLQRALQFRKLPIEIAERYRKAYPGADFRALCVVASLKGSPAEKVFKGGDLIVSVNGQAVGPDLALFEHLMNQASGESVEVAFYRDGQLLKRKVGLYNLHDYTVKRLLIFGGATFFEVDDFLRWRFNVLPKSVLVRHTVPGSSFYKALVPSFSALPDNFFQNSERLCQMLDFSLSDWVKRISILVRQKNFLLNVRWLMPVHSGFSGEFLNTTAVDSLGVRYRAEENSPPELLTYDDEPKKWQVSAVLCNGEQGA